MPVPPGPRRCWCIALVPFFAFLPNRIKPPLTWAVRTEPGGSRRRKWWKSTPQNALSAPYSTLKYWFRRGRSARFCIFFKHLRKFFKKIGQILGNRIHCVYSSVHLLNKSVKGVPRAPSIFGFDSHRSPLRQAPSSASERLSTLCFKDFERRETVYENYCVTPPPDGGRVFVVACRGGSRRGAEE